MPQFVILRHTLPEGSERPSHFDLMLEYDSQLLTWAVASIPSRTPQLCEELPPHRLDYLTYEGPVSNKRGEVAKVAKGTIEWIVHEPDRIEVRIDDGQWFGRLKLLRVEQGRWTVVCECESAEA